jgi:hypothetical protein
MWIVASNSRRPPRGSAITLVVFFLGLSVTLIATGLSWTTTNANLTDRTAQYYRTLAAAEAATEKILTRMCTDYQRHGDSRVFANLNAYRGTVPTPSEHGLWAGYQFFDVGQSEGRTQVDWVPPAEFRVLSSQYRGLRGYATAFRVISNARETGSRHAITASVRQDVEVATIPLFQFAIFYNLELEVNPGPAMTITGPVHCNTNIYCQPQNVLTFASDVTAVGSIIHNKKPSDPLVRSGGSIVYRAEHDGGVSTLTLPIGTNSHPDAVRAVVEIPPEEESPTSAMGRERYYNKADLIIRVTDAGVVAKSGRADNFATTIPSSQVEQFLDPNVTFFNKREGKTIKTTQIDVTKLRQWNATNTLLRPLLPYGDLTILYVSDTRSQNSGTEPGVSLVNGQTLLPRGLTVVTPQPAYVKGHYNAPHPGTTNTSAALPASIVADAITVLSGSWIDGHGTCSFACREASDTTVNAAFLAGVVPTTTNSYSGGVENFPRFLENWSGRTFTYNGSMVVMFPSQFATGAWRGTGSAIGIYNPPTRNWAFDQNFRDPSKVPPGCPSVRVLIRGSWLTPAPFTSS